MKVGRLSVAFCLVALLSACKPSGTGSSGGTEAGAEKGEKPGSKHLVVLTTENFELQVLASEQLVMVDFWAPWCPPCLELAPTISELADDYAGKVKVGKVDVNVEGNKPLSDKYVGEGIPVVKFFKGGKQVDEILGLVPKEVLEKKINKHL
jgi:thioredoxin 1